MTHIKCPFCKENHPPIEEYCKQAKKEKEENRENYYRSLEDYFLSQDFKEINNIRKNILGNWKKVETKSTNILWFDNCSYEIIKLENDDNLIGIRFNFNQSITPIMKFNIEEIKELIKSLGSIIDYKIDFKDEIT